MLTTLRRLWERHVSYEHVDGRTTALLGRVPLIRYKRIRDRDMEELYLSRYWLLGSENSPLALMLHHMHRPDNDSCHHDHPWAFITLVLRGGYIEQVTRPDGTVHTVRNHVGHVRYRAAKHTHRIDRLPAGTCWTLVLRMPKTRSWGFHTKQGWVHWRVFIDWRQHMGIIWCDTLDKERKP